MKYQDKIRKVVPLRGLQFDFHTLDMTKKRAARHTK
jgi:hypothetical protein